MSAETQQGENIEVVSNWRKSVQLPKSVCNFNLEKLRRKEKKIKERIKLLEEEIAYQTRKTKIKAQTINLTPESLIICRKLSNSINHSEVFEVKIDGWKCAMKKTKKYANNNDIECFISEVEIHSKILPHPNIIQYLFHQYINNELCLFMTLKTCTLKDAIIQKMQKNQTFTSKEIAEILIACAKGLSHLNDENHIIHRDVKSENIFIDIGPHGEIVDVTIADFDTSIQIEESTKVTGVIGTRGFIAPEVLTCEEIHEYNYKADVYSFGMMCYELMTFTTPFENIQNQNEHFNRIISGDTPTISKEKIRLYAPLVALHLSCVSLSPASRPSWSEVISILEVIKDPPVI